MVHDQHPSSSNGSRWQHSEGMLPAWTRNGNVNSTLKCNPFTFFFVSFWYLASYKLCVFWVSVCVRPVNIPRSTSLNVFFFLFQRLTLFLQLIWKPSHFLDKQSCIVIKITSHSSGEQVYNGKKLITGQHVSTYPSVNGDWACRAQFNEILSTYCQT